MFNINKYIDRLHSMSPEDVAAIVENALKDAGIESNSGGTGVLFDGLFSGEDNCYQQEDICPICGAYIEAHDGEENGYGELHLYWKCGVCKTSGKAVVDLHDDNAFIEHIITDIKE